MYVLTTVLRSSQRSESTNSVLTSLANKQMGLFAVFTAVENMLKDWRNRALEEDFQNIGVVNVRAEHSKILVDASKVYTRTILKEFEKELFVGVFAESKAVSEVGGVIEYEVLVGNQDWRKFNVKYDAASLSVSCSCMLFEERGLLCCHSLRVLNVNNVHEIPKQYILHRWTKEARIVVDQDGKYLCGDAFSTIAWRTNMMRGFLSLVIECQKDQECRYVCEQGLLSMQKHILKMKAGTASASKECQTISSAGSCCEVDVLNPAFVTSNIFGSKQKKSGVDFNSGCGCRGKGRGSGRGRDGPV